MCFVHCRRAVSNNREIESTGFGPSGFLALDISGTPDSMREGGTPGQATRGLDTVPPEDLPRSRERPSQCDQSLLCESPATLAATNKCLAQMNKSGTSGTATKKVRNPASRVDPMGADHRVVSAIKEALSMLPQPRSQRAMLTSNDYKELAARCTELASESCEPTVAEALRALASDYLARAAKLHFVFLEPRHEAARHEHCRR